MRRNPAMRTATAGLLVLIPITIGGVSCVRKPSGPSVAPRASADVVPDDQPSRCRLAWRKRAERVRREIEPRTTRPEDVDADAPWMRSGPLANACRHEPCVHSWAEAEAQLARLAGRGVQVNPDCHGKRVVLLRTIDTHDAWFFDSSDGHLVGRSSGDFGGGVQRYGDTSGFDDCGAGFVVPPEVAAVDRGHADAWGYSPLVPLTPASLEQAVAELCAAPMQRDHVAFYSDCRGVDVLELDDCTLYAYDHRSGAFMGRRSIVPWTDDLGIPTAVPGVQLPAPRSSPADAVSVAGCRPVRVCERGGVPRGLMKGPAATIGMSLTATDDIDPSRVATSLRERLALPPELPSLSADLERCLQNAPPREKTVPPAPP